MEEIQDRTEKHLVNCLQNLKADYNYFTKLKMMQSYSSLAGLKNIVIFLKISKISDFLDIF